MGKILQLIKSKRKIAFIIVVLCGILVSGIIVVSDLAKSEAAAGTKSEIQNNTAIDEAVGIAIKGQGKGYGPGEVNTEGHIILDTEEKGNTIKVYTIASFGAFGFEDGIFTKVSGSGAISTVITLSRNEEGNYYLKEYKEPMDGNLNLKSKKKMFPKNLWSKVISEHKYYPELAKQQEEQAKQYLSSIGRTVKVSEAHVEKKLPEINVEASNKLFAELTKYDAELNNFPFWIGTKELFDSGVRYIYETSQGKTEDGYDLMSFRKTKEDGTVVKEYHYKIVGTEPKLITK
jgi:bla regulator protein blaR1